jgi:hypothetical protein
VIVEESLGGGENEEAIRPGSDCNNPISQALFDSESGMRKGPKSDFNKYLVEREFPQTLSNQYSATHAWILEGMFMINSIPLANCFDI